MPEYLSPGVYVEEVSSGARPIEGVSTTTAGFVGQTERGPVKPRMVTSWLDYQRWFGGYLSTEDNPDPSPYLPFAVEGFFTNGGQRAFIARITGDGALAATGTLKDAAGGDALKLDANGPGDWGNRIRVDVLESQMEVPNAPASDQPFSLLVSYFTAATWATIQELIAEGKLSDPPTWAELSKAGLEPELQETYNDVTVVANASNNVAAAINSGSKLVLVPEDGVTARPEPDQVEMLSGGTKGDDITVADYTGEGSTEPDLTGLASLGEIPEISMLVAPDQANPALPSNGQLSVALINQCEALKDRFAILAVDKAKSNVQEIRPIEDTSYGATYYPWIRIYNPRTNRPLLVPPTGHLSGLYARNDITQGVQHAPANEVLAGLYLSGGNPEDGPLEFLVSKGQQDILNPRGIDVIRDFRSAGRGVRVWGARTMSSDPEWRYVNVRRLFLFVEQSIEQGTQWVVFEPNVEATWAAVVTSISGFLNQVWRSGGLAGIVKCDRTTMTQQDIDSGRLICLVGIAPVKPAEFVIIRIGQKTLEAS